MYKQNALKKTATISLIAVFMLIILVISLWLTGVFLELHIWYLNGQYDKAVNVFNKQIKYGPDDYKEALKFIKEDETINKQLDKMEHISSEVKSILENSYLSETRKKQLYGFYDDMNNINKSHRGFQTLYDKYDQMSFSEKVDASSIIIARKVRKKL